MSAHAGWHIRSPNNSQVATACSLMEPSMKQVARAAKRMRRINPRQYSEHCKSVLRTHAILFAGGIANPLIRAYRGSGLITERAFVAGGTPSAVANP
jgi:hypothetical protein